MAWIRYIAYFVAIAFVTWALTQMELASPGSLKLHVLADEHDVFGTSEYSPVEIIQVIILGACGVIMGWVARYCPTQRPIAFLFGGMALIFLIRELDYFLDRFLIDNLWQVLAVLAAAPVMVYTYRQRRRLQIALARIWPSPGLTFLFCGAVILFAFVRLVGHEPLWMSILGDAYQRVVKLAVEEFIELIGYFLWMVGTIDYAFQARAIAFRDLQSAARKRRDKRRHDAEGRF
jgi:hypothetical protein